MMYQIVRPMLGHLMICERSEGTKRITWPQPDAEFWPWLKASGWRKTLTDEDPDRMKRVDEIGVGVLRCEKWADMTRAETVSKRPLSVGAEPRPILIETKETIDDR